MQGLKYRENTADEPPNCLNAHVDRGGKRGSALKIFPAQDDTAAFPFKVEIGQTRKWASFSTARTDGEYKCWTGVVFQPSRMALDSYKIRVTLATPRKADKSTPTLDDKSLMADLSAAHRGLPAAETGLFEVRRRIDAKYVRKSSATTPIDLRLIDGMYALAGIDIVWTNAFWNATDYRKCFADSEEPDDLNIDLTYVRNKRHPHPRAKLETIKRYRKTRSAIPFSTYDHWSGEIATAPSGTANDCQLTLPGREVVLAKYVASLMEDYINKKPNVDRKQRKWKKIQKKYAELTVEGQYLRFYEEAVTQEVRTSEKFDTKLKEAYEKDGWLAWDVAQDNPVQWAADNYFYGIGFGPFMQELHQRAVMADPFDGVSFYHYTHLYQTKNLDGTLEAHQCDLGGWLPSE